MGRRRNLSKDVKRGVQKTNQKSPLTTSPNNKKLSRMNARKKHRNNPFKWTRGQTMHKVLKDSATRTNIPVNQFSAQSLGDNVILPIRGGSDLSKNPNKNLTCRFPGCGRSKQKEQSILLFEFPEDSSQKAIWMKHCSNPPLWRRNFLCDKHFYAKDLLRLRNKTALSKTAVPKSAVNCLCDESGIRGSCEDLLATPEDLGECSAQQKLLERMTLSGDYIPLDNSTVQSAVSQPKDGPSTTAAPSQDPNCDESLAFLAPAGKTSVAESHKPPKKEEKEEGLCDSTTQDDEDEVQEISEDSLDCSDVVMVSSYLNATARKDESVQNIPSDDDVIEVPSTDASVIIIEDDSFANSSAVPSPARKRLRKSAKTPEKPQISAKGKRPRFVVIDGSNVAFHHSVLKKVFSVEGLKIAIEHFEKKGHEVVAVVPLFRVKPRFCTNSKLLNELNLQGKVIFSPSKNIDGHCLSTYDDMLIMQVAEKNRGAVISNDNYADILGRNEAWDCIIRSRVVGFTWFKDQFFLPMDPYGRDGPKINDILYY
ncbi:uncharacterized protein LOC132260712 [Phlebotomus argentipes]|uniref:uncharacterized protein LOC132260712 n=1 Tax=Phlebotomus argentipes TaxID=94469 RepID=UPI002892EC9D|nr:uncharacterized protein LOC132260712 [Phlebotomus argentipes]